MTTASIYGTLLAGDRQTYRLAEKLGEGGQGAVYVVEDRPDLAAKIYHEFDYLREEKLHHLSRMATKRLVRISAWPLSELRDAENKVVGFVMPYLNGWQRLHNVYNVRQRLQFHPDRSWQFMVRASRNLAVCLHHVHTAGLIVGDLNESNVLVDHRAMVKLIDVDSFQVKVGDRLHGCYVGRPELLAPELQGHSLVNKVRTEAQDRFALAVLIFQLLNFGRHPYAGRQDDDEERSLESSIRNGHYAYSKLRPGPLKPPKLAEIDYLPPDIQQLFERAFGKEIDARPSALEWFTAMRKLETSLRACSENEKHKYWTGRKDCPWCRVEQEGGLSLFPAKFSPADLQVDADALWKDIERVVAKFEALPAPAIVEYKDLEPAALSRYERFAGRSSFYWIPLFHVAWLSTKFGIPPDAHVALKVASFVGIAVGISALSTWPLIKNSPARGKVDKARKNVEALSQKYEATASRQTFEVELQKLRDKRDFLLNFEASTQKVRDKMVRARYGPQLETFLRKYSILGADIGQFGRDQVASLHDHGIKTASDVTDAKLEKRAEGYPKVISALKKWRSKLEDQFWSTANFGLSVVEEQKLHREMFKEAQEAKKALRDGPDMLEDLIAEIHVRRMDLTSQMEPFQETIRELGPKLRAFDILGKAEPKAVDQKPETQVQA